MERVPLDVTLRLRAARLAVYPLDGRGHRMTELSGEAVQAVEGGWRIRLHAEGQDWSPWYEIVAER